METNFRVSNKLTHAVTVITIMKLVYSLQLVLIVTNIPSEARKVNGARKVNVGCNLQVPDAVKQQMEAMGNKGNPLIISVDMKVLGVRDVPDSGGSYGVDLR